MKKKFFFPIDCKHRNFFNCASPKQCLGCYYNPVKEIAIGVDYNGEEGNGIWFYEDVEWSTQALIVLEQIKTGKLLLPGGTKLKMKYARNAIDENIID